MRGRMNAPSGASYAAAVPIGGVMEGDAVGEVVASNSDLFAVGDFAMGKIGWQEYGVMDARDVRKIDPDAAPISTSVGILGMPGLTAYHGLFEVAKPVAGDTVVVTAASGAVGAVVGQLAKRNGCRVIGVAGSQEKGGLRGRRAGVRRRHRLQERRCPGALSRAVPARHQRLLGQAWAGRSPTPPSTRSRCSAAR